MLPACDQSTSSCEIKLRELEIDSYSKILSVFRARGNLTNERRKLLKQICTFLNISQERHRAEVRRVTSDELLSTIASRLTGQDWTYDWNEEGKRLVPTPTPFSHYTVNTPFADYIASVASLGKKYVDLYNKRICDSVPNGEKTSDSLDNCEKPSEKWLDEINEVFTIAQKEKVKDVSVQTVKKKTIPKKCTYCERRKEFRKKKLEAKEKEKNKQEVADNTIDEKKPEDDDSNIALPSGKQIQVENECNEPVDDLSASVIAQEVTVETEPTPGPSHIPDVEEPSIEEPTIGNPIPFFSLATPDFTGLNLDSSKVQSKDFMDPTSIHLFTDMWEDSEKPLPPRIPRILNSGPRKRVRKQNLHSHITHKYLSHGEKCIKRKGGENLKESFSKESSSEFMGSSQIKIKYSKSAQILPPSNRHGPSKHHHSSKLGEGGLRQYESHKNTLESHKHTNESHKHHNEGHKHSHEGSKHLSHRNPENTSKPNLGVLRHHDVFSKQHESISKHKDTVPKHREIISKQHEVLLKHHEGINKYPEVVPKRIDSSSKQTGGIYKHYVRVRHTPKANRPFSEVSKHSEMQSSKNLGETLEAPIEYLKIDQPSSAYETQMDVVNIDNLGSVDFRLGTSSLCHNLTSTQRENEPVAIESLQVFHDSVASDQSINFLTSGSPVNTIVQQIFIPTSSASSVSNSEGRNIVHKEENSSKKVIKVFNGDKKVHGPIHFRSDHQLKDILNKFPNSQISQVDVNNGCQNEDNTENMPEHTIWDGTNLSGSEFIMEDVSIVDDSSYPIVNGHEEIILEEEVLTGSQIIESLVKDNNITDLVDKSEVCIIPQTDMKFSVVDLTDYTDSIESIHSISSQSKDDSRDSDIVLNRP